MINIAFNLRNPFSDRWDIIKSWSGATPFKHKFWECQVDKTADIIGAEIRITAKQDHAGIFLSLALLGYDIIFNVYDSRHWDYDSDEWVIYNDN